MSAGTVDETPVDLEPIMPGRVPLTLEGINVRVIPLRLRETFTIAKIIGAGLGGGLLDMDVAWDDPETLRGQIGALIFIALPAATDEVIVFLRDIVKPVDSDDAGRLRQVMANPYPGDVLDIIDVLLDQEGETIAALVGKARRMAPKINQLLPKQVGDPGRGPEPSTSSQPNTDGQTNTSSGSPSDE